MIRTVVYRVQSSVPAHSELAWMLTADASGLARSGMTQYKGQVGGTGNDPTGRQYPVLMRRIFCCIKARIVRWATIGAASGADT